MTIVPLSIAEEREDLSDQLLQLSDSLYDIADQDDSKTAAIQAELDKTLLLLQDQNANITGLVNDAEVLKEKIALIKATQNDIDRKFNEINLNYEKYVFQTRAKAILPFVYAAIALSVGEESDESPLLYGLAGYGTGALIENTGYGLASGITWLTYSFDF